MTPAKTLAKALARQIGADSILSWQDGPKMQGQFVVVQVVSTRPIGQEEVRYKNDPNSLDVIETVYGKRELMYSVEVYRNSETTQAADRAELLRLKMCSTAFRYAMLSYGLGLVRVSEVRDRTNPVDAAAEARFGFDVFYNTVQTVEDTVLAIESVVITGIFQPVSATVTED